jgi:hypothetical protein
MQNAKTKLEGYQYYEDRIFPFQFVPVEHDSKSHKRFIRKSTTKCNMMANSEILKECHAQKMTRRAIKNQSIDIDNECDFFIK